MYFTMATVLSLGSLFCRGGRGGMMRGGPQGRGRVGPPRGGGMGRGGDRGGFGGPGGR